MASRVSCVRETARQGRPRFMRAFLYLSICRHLVPLVYIAACVRYAVDRAQGGVRTSSGFTPGRTVPGSP